MNPLVPRRSPSRPGEVLLVCLAVPESLPPALSRGLVRALPDDERERLERYGHPRAATEFLCGRALLRAMLSSRHPVAHQAWRFDVNEHGRPGLSGPSTATPTFFNLSHTRGMVVLALGDDPFVGVDVERLDRVVRPLEFADRYFSPAESDGLRALPAERHRDRFLALWTLKEAYIKARGMGLALPLRDFTFTPDEVPPRVGFAPSLDDDPTAWRFARTDLASGHRVAVAAKVPRLDVILAEADLDALAAGVRLPPGDAAV